MWVRSVTSPGKIFRGYPLTVHAKTVINIASL